jgi:hypothetical protein
MKYMLLIYGNEATSATWTQADYQAEMQDYWRYNQDMQERGVLVAGEALKGTETATNVRVRDGKTLITDGPFAETKEQLGGFYILDCKDLDEAIELAARIPGALHGTVEIRPIVVFDDAQA